MNKSIFILVLILLAIGSTGKAQVTPGTPVENYSVIEKKLKKSDANITDSVQTAKPKFWINRAEALMDAFEVDRNFLLKGTLKVIVEKGYGVPKEPKTWQEGANVFEQYVYDRVNVIIKDGVLDSYEVTKPLYENPIPEALKALDKAQKLDVENKSKKALKEDFTRLKRNFEILGEELFVKKDYNEAFNAFSSISLINEQSVMGGYVDTFALYNAGLSAYNAKRADDAIKFFELAKKYNHPEPNLYVLLEQSYVQKGDSITGVKVLEEGFKRFPNDQGVQVELINYFLTKGESEKALNYLSVAQQNDPKNVSFIFAEGTLYDKMGNNEKAEDTYKRCIDLDPNYYEAYYNIGVDHFNKAAKMYEDAAKIDVKNQKDYEAAQEAADTELSKAIPYMEKAHELKPTDDGTMKTLRTIYIRLKMTDKKEAIDKEIQAL
jgi:tetratricopeptide (TPR) repeat protein